MLKRIVLTIILLNFSSLPACTEYDNREVDEMIDIGTHSLYLLCIGQESPTVVIDTGVGDTAERWSDFQSQVAKFTHVCTYDRAGYGLSEPGPFPRHSQQMADELQQLLETASLHGPYILMGHSLGGLNAQEFADRYPDLVTGLILLDPSPIMFITGQAFPELYQLLAFQTDEFRNMAEAAHKSPDPGTLTQANYLEAIASEHASLINESTFQVAAIESFGDLPLTVIGSGLPNPAFGTDAERFQQFWIEQSRELAARSTNGRFVLAQESTHYIQEDAPDLILDIIRKMLEKVR